MSSRYAKRHYADVASILKEARKHSKSVVIRRIEKDFIRMFKNDNSRFDEDMFLQASGFKK